MSKFDSSTRLFLVAGAPKAATTTVGTALAAHHQVALPRTGKSTHFFDDHWDRGTEHLEAQFDARPFVGEISEGYFTNPEVPARVAKVWPDAKVVFLLREPVERAISHYRWRRTNVGESRSWANVLDSDTNFPVDFGRYGTNIGRFLEHFDASQVHYFLFERFREQPEAELGALFSFLGLEGAPAASAIPRVNPARDVKSPGISRWMKTAGRSRLAKLVPKPVLLAAQRAYRNLNDAPPPPPPTEQEIARMMEVFRPETEKLEALLGQPMERWKSRPWWSN